MARKLPLFVAESIFVLTYDVRTLLGSLLSCDQLTNLVLFDTIERIFDPMMTLRIVPRLLMDFISSEAITWQS